jgi:transglutaminase-like putative cysteine protease
MQPLLSFPLPSSDEIPSILAVLRNMADLYCREPAVRRAAVQIIRGQADNDQLAQLRAVTEFVKSRMQYVRDTMGVEYTVAPDLLLRDIAEHGSAAGDCDDHVLLLVSLLQSIGFPCRIVAVKIPPSPLFNHVIAQALYRGEWMDIDPCAKTVPVGDYRERRIA